MQGNLGEAKLSLVLAALIVLVGLLMGCQGAGTENGTGGAIASIAITPETAAIELGQTQTFTVVARDASGNPLSVSFAWHSSNPAVATVIDGVATAVGEGTTAITASAGNVTSNAASLTVTSDDGDEPPTIASFTADPTTIVLGESSTLSWSVSGATSLSISPDIGPVMGSSVTVQPEQTTEYTLTATNAAGEASARTTVTVIGAEPPPGVSNTIAYVRPNDESGDEIRLIQPDGSGDRLIWSTGQADPFGVEAITSLAWRPDGRELAFTSDHEAACSWYESDVYAVHADGGGLRRVTNAPTCAGLAGYPKGRVTVGVENLTFQSGLFQIYVQGATTLEQISLSPGAGGTVTFEEVADLGEGIQPAVAILGGSRWLGGAVANVRPGETVDAGTLSISGSGFWGLGADKVRWHADGSRLGYVFAECAGLYRMPAEPGPGEVGTPLLDAGTHDISPCVMDWGPTPATSQQVLYATSGFDDRGIYLTTEGGGVGTNLVSLEVGSGQFIYDLKWLPDGSGFVFIMQTVEFEIMANIYRYDFASGAITQLTPFTEGFARALSISPDAQHVVFERSAAMEDDAAAELWVIRSDGAEMRLLVANGRAPAWSR